MATNNGVADYSGIVHAVFNTDGISMSFQYPEGMSIYTTFDDVLTAVQSAIADTESTRNGKKTYMKELARIAIHRDQLQDALSKLLATYVAHLPGEKVAKTRQSAAYKARYAMLNGMRDKMLRAYAEDFLPDGMGDLILPDDREVLIAQLCAALADEQSSVTVNAT